MTEPSHPSSEGADADTPKPGAALATFSLEGRSVPALYLIGWVGSVMGLAIIVVSVLAGRNAASPWIFLAGLILLALGIVAGAGSQAVERGRHRELAYHGPSPVLLLAVVIVLTLLAIVVLLAPLGRLGLDLDSPLGMMSSLAITTALYWVVVRLLVVGPGALSWTDMGLRHPPAAAVRDFLVGALVAGPVLVVSILVGLLLSQFLKAPQSVLPPSRDTIGTIADLVSAAVLAPLGEELFFRGFATTAWTRAMGVRRGIVAGAVLFAAAHVLTVSGDSAGDAAQQALYAFVALLPVAFVLGWLFIARRSLYAAYGLHAAYNLWVALALVSAGSVRT